MLSALNISLFEGGTAVLLSDPATVEGSAVVGLLLRGLAYPGASSLQGALFLMAYRQGSLDLKPGLESRFQAWQRFGIRCRGF